MSSKLHFLAAFAALSVLISACNVDPVWPDRQRVDGPVVGEPYRPKTPPHKGADILEVTQQEVDLVEDALSTRADYHAKLRALRDYYQMEGYPTKASWADFELTSARNIKQFRYVIDSEVPAGELRAAQSIPEADKLYEGGLKLMRKGAAGPFYREKVMVEAAQTFKRLIELYPDSDKIDDAAFQLGEIHKEYLPDQELLAVKWYERAKQEAGFGAFEVRTYRSLMRHWLCSRIAMYFLAAQTQRLRGEKSEDHPGAGRRRGQYAGYENLEDVPRFVEGADSPLRILSRAQ